MKKISCVLAAVATIAVAAPTVASAEGFSFRVGGDRDYYRDRDDYRGSRVDFTNMIAGCIAAGMIMMTNNPLSVIVTGMTGEDGP